MIIFIKVENVVIPKVEMKSLLVPLANFETILCFQVITLLVLEDE